MAEPLWSPRHPWAGIAQAGAFGNPNSDAMQIDLRPSPGLATLFAQPGGEEALAQAVNTLLGLPLPGPGQASMNERATLLWSGARQWLLLSEMPEALPAWLATLAPHAAISHQDGSRALLTLSGQRARDVLARGVMIDLHDREFPVGAAALTSIAHMPVMLWRLPDAPEGPTFQLASARSMAGSLWAWLKSATAVFGGIVTMPAVSAPPDNPGLAGSGAVVYPA
jgi:heterotetrameric sarcosine oxidase gamma subunit